MVLLILAVVWVVALTPMVLKKLSERQVLGSVTSFNRKLGHLRSQNSGYGQRVFGLGPIGFSAAAERVHEEHRFDAGASSGHTTREVEAVPAVASRATIIRRRRVLVSLIGATLFAFLLGIVVSLFLDLAFLGLFLTAVYVGLLVYFHRLAVERAQKVVALETRRQVLSALEEARVVGATGAGPATSYGAAFTITGSHRSAGPSARRLVGSGDGRGAAATATGFDVGERASVDRVRFAGAVARG